MMRRLWLAAACVVLLGADAGADPREREARVGAVLGRVAEWARAKDELSRAGGADRRAEIRGRLERMEAELARDRIDYTSFVGVKSRCEDIHGDFFFDGAWIENTIYHRFLRLFNLCRNVRRLVGRPRGASDATPSGGVPDSALFINRDIASISPESLAAEDALIAPRGGMTITGRKKEGKSEGFYGRDERGEEYIVIVDPPGMLEQETAAEVIGSTLVRMAGYNIASSSIVSISGTGNPQFDGRRGVATRLVKGFKGHWSYRDFKDRREIRATMIFAGWLHNTDWVDHNTGISVCEVEGVPLTRYYIFDFGGSLGSWNIRTKEPRDGWEYYVDFGEILLWPLLKPMDIAGLRRRPWPADGRQFSEAVGYFDSRFPVDRYRSNYPNLAWAEMTREDGLWAAGLIASYTGEQVRAAVDLARYTNPADADYVFRTLMERRRRILEFYGLAPQGGSRPSPG